MSHIHYKIGIIGAGLTGQIAALALSEYAQSAAANIDVTLFGALPDYRDERAFFLSPGSESLLQRLSLLDGVTLQTVSRMDVRDGGDGGAGRDLFPLIFDGSAQRRENGMSEDLGIIIEASDLTSVLRRKIIDADIHLVDMLATEINSAESGATLILQNGQSLELDLVIIADGRHSKFREQLGIDCLRLDYGQQGIVSVLTHSSPHKGVAYQTFLRGGPFATLPLPEKDGQHRSALVWSLPESAAKAALSLSAQDVVAALAPHIPAPLGQLEHASRAQGFSLILQLAKSYIAPHAVLIGDAAHVIHPLAGQGLNLGLKDIAALIDVIDEGFTSGEAFGSAQSLSRYERWRRSDAAQLAAATDGLARLYRLGVPGAGHIRRLGMGAVNRSGVLKRAFIKEASGRSGDFPSWTEEGGL